MAGSMFSVSNELCFIQIRCAVGIGQLQHRSRSHLGDA